jgi:sugar-specific transcriptional regulator TrmB
MSVEEIKTLLKQSGLTEYEAKACLALIRFGKCNAEKISSIGGIPLPRVYDTMSSLAKRGLVSVSKTRPQTFRITDFKRFFNILKSDEKREFEKKTKEIDNVSSKFLNVLNSLKIETPKEEKEDILSYVRRINVGEMWEEIQNGTKKEFLVFAGDLSWVESKSKDISKIIKKGVKYKVLWFKPIKEIVPNVKKALKLGVDLRCFNDHSNELRALVSDNKKLYLIRKTLKHGVDAKTIKEGSHWSEDIADYNGVLITSKLISKVFRDYFYLLWNKAMTAENFLKKYK